MGQDPIVLGAMQTQNNNGSCPEVQDGGRGITHKQREQCDGSKHHVCAAGLVSEGYAAVKGEGTLKGRREDGKRSDADVKSL